jgi:ribosome-binding protein aMBF1 (putative translation factor)
MDKSNNPLKPGAIHTCEYCSKKLESKDIRLYFGKFDLYFCAECFEKWADNLPDPEDIREHTFYGLDEKYVEPHPNRVVIKTFEKETFEEYSERVEEEHQTRQLNRAKEDFRKRMREYMQNRNLEKNVKQLNRNRFEKLKKEFGGSPVINKAPEICPKCKNEKTWKSGFVYTKDGRYQRRRCSGCGFVYTDDWSE